MIYLISDPRETRSKEEGNVLIVGNRGRAVGRVEKREQRHGESSAQMAGGEGQGKGQVPVLGIHNKEWTICKTLTSIISYRG